MKTHWTLEGLQYTRDNGGVKVGKKNFFKVFTPAWEKISTVDNLQSGFRATAMFPVNFHAVPGVAFVPSMTAEQNTGETSTAFVNLPDFEPQNSLLMETDHAVSEIADVSMDQLTDLQQVPVLAMQQTTTGDPIVVICMPLSQIQLLDYLVSFHSGSTEVTYYRKLILMK